QHMRYAPSRVVYPACPPTDHQTGFAQTNGPRWGAGFVCIGWLARYRVVALAAFAAFAPVVISTAARGEPAGPFAGPYVGINAGAAWGQSSFSTNPNCPATIVDATFCNAAPDPSAVNGTAVAESGSRKLSPLGFTGGAQAGYNWQRGHIV